MSQFGNVDYSYSRISGTAAGTTTIKSGYGLLGAIFTGVSTAGTITYYDSSSGTNANIIAIVPSNGANIPFTHVLNCRFTQGLVAVQSAGTADQTVTYS